MKTGKRLQRIFLGAFCVGLIWLYLTSSVWFRLRLADFYRANHNYIKAVQVCRKILTKNSVKRNLNDESFCRINFSMGGLYARLNLRNLAIESYANTSAKAKDIKTENHYIGDSLDNDMLLAIGLLEAGEPDKAIAEFKRLQFLYPKSQDTEKYIEAAGILKNMNLTPGCADFLFSIGDIYIQCRLFGESRAFFTKRIMDYGARPLEVLSYLQKKYMEDTQIRQEVWGDNIYVTLEDFETAKPKLANWLSNVRGRINHHHITDKAAYKGHYSEFFDITYTDKKERKWDHERWDFYYFAKTTDISLDNANLTLGIRLYIKSIGPSKYTLCFNTIYPKARASGICYDFFSQAAGKGWEEYRLENLSERAKSVAFPNNWNTDEMTVDKIIVDAKGFSDKFFIDEIELYLAEKDPSVL